MKTTIQSSVVSKIVDLINGGIEQWIQAGRIVAEEVDKNPRFIEDFCSQVNNISEEVLHRFEQIGRQEIYPYLMTHDGPGVRRLRTLPYMLQKQFWNEPVPVLIREGGKTEILAVDVRNLTPFQARQVFSRDGVRTTAAQRAWLEDQRAQEQAAAETTNPPYRVVGNRVIVMAPCQFSRKDLARILADMD